MIDIEDIIYNEILNHSLENPERECCGVVIVKNGLYRYVPCRNEAGHNNHFIINGEDYANAEDQGEISHIVHSHPYARPDPSETDLVSIEKTGLPWIIVSPQLRTHTITYPSGFKMPLIGREFHHGVVDCYTLVRDYYKEVLNIELSDYHRDDQWWELGQDLYNENYDREGFFVVPDNTIQVHDVFLMRIASKKENHAAIYIGNNKILHHPMNRLSTEDIYGGWWQKITSRTFRHKSLA